jgi:hypothetical protein
MPNPIETIDQNAVTRAARAWLSVPLVAVGAMLVAAAVVAAGRINDYDLAGFAWIALGFGAFYGVGVAVVLRRPARRGDFLLILAVAVLLRGIALTTAPGLTTDAYRYVWDGRLTLSGISPYAYVPADPRLERFRDPAIYPNINQRETAHTVYPPAAQLVFAAGAYLDRWLGTGRDDGHNGMKAAMLIAELVLVLALAGWLNASGVPRERLLIYAWHPIPLFEIASQAHIDVVAAALLMLAVLAAETSRSVLAGAMLAAAGAVKYFPVVAAPALWRRWDWRGLVVFVAVVAAFYAAPVAEVGQRVIGFMSGLLDNEGYRDGYGFHIVLLLRDLGLPSPSGTGYTMAALALLAALALRAQTSQPAAGVRADHLLALAAAFVWLTSPHYPWYFLWLVPLLAAYPNPGVLAMTLLCVTLYIPGANWILVYAVTYWLPLAVAIAAELKYRAPGRQTPVTGA